MPDCVAYWTMYTMRACVRGSSEPSFFMIIRANVPIRTIIEKHSIHRKGA